MSNVSQGAEYRALTHPIDYQLVLYLHHVVAALSTLFTWSFIIMTLWICMNLTASQD